QVRVSARARRDRADARGRAGGCDRGVARGSCRARLPRAVRVASGRDDDAGPWSRECGRTVRGGGWSRGQSSSAKTVARAAKKYPLREWVGSVRSAFAALRIWQPAPITLSDTSDRDQPSVRAGASPAPL